MVFPLAIVTLTRTASKFWPVPGLWTREDQRKASLSFEDYVFVLKQNYHYEIHSSEQETVTWPFMHLLGVYTAVGAAFSTKAELPS